MDRTMHTRDSPVDPPWARTLRKRFVTGEAAMFLLHGALQDWVDLGTRLCSMPEYLDEHLLRSKTIIVHYNLSTGLSFASKAQQELAVQLVNARRQVAGRTETDARILPRGPAQALEVLEDLLVAAAVQDGAGRFRNTVGVVLEYIETLAPAGEMLYLSENERRVLTTLQRWTSAPFLLDSNNIVLLLGEQVARINQELVRDPMISPVELSLPDLDERRHALALLSPKPLPPQVPELTSGLSRVQMQQLIRRLPEDFDEQVVLDTVRQGKKQQIEQECAGLLEFIQPRHGFETIGGHDRTKQLLQDVAAQMRSGQMRRVPMGMMFVGPMGTGKTVLANAFAKECGLNCVTLKNFRDKWVGATEANLEKIISVLQAMGPLIVVIDEGDRAFGSDGAEGDSGTSSRVMARLKAFMSDTSHRGYLLFILMTNRPDKLDLDMKRAGRLDVKVPFFSPQTVDDIQAVFQALARKHGLTLQLDPEALHEALSPLVGYAGADIEALLLQAGAEDSIDRDTLAAAIYDYIPSRDREMIRFMELLAVFECSSRRLLPETYRDRGTEDLLMEMETLRLRLRARGV